MELAISVITGFMILGALYAIHAKDLLSSVIACGIVGYSLVICFLLLKAPDLAIVQIVVDTITLIIMVAVVHDSSRNESYSKLDTQGYISAATIILLIMLLLYFFAVSIKSLDVLGPVHYEWQNITLKVRLLNLVAQTLLPVWFLTLEVMIQWVKPLFL